MRTAPRTRGAPGVSSAPSSAGEAAGGPPPPPRRRAAPGGRGLGRGGERRGRGAPGRRPGARPPPGEGALLGADHARRAAWGRGTGCGTSHATWMAVSSRRGWRAPRGRGRPPAPCPPPRPSTPRPEGVDRRTAHSARASPRPPSVVALPPEADDDAAGAPVERRRISSPVPQVPGCASGSRSPGWSSSYPRNLGQLDHRDVPGQLAEPGLDRAPQGVGHRGRPGGRRPRRPARRGCPRRRRRPGRPGSRRRSRPGGRRRRWPGRRRRPAAPP